MGQFLLHVIRRIFSILVTLLITTTVLYLTVMLTPPETRAEIFMPPGGRQTEAQRAHMIEMIIEKNHLNDSFPIQYYYWITGMLQGNWGYSPTLHEDVFSAIVTRAPVTAELTLYSILLFMPLGLLSGVIAGTRQNRWSDHGFRLTAYIATSLPPFILALILLAFFYVSLYWFAPERIGISLGLFVASKNYHAYTGLLTIDGLLNNRPDITLEAFRHLAMPVITLAFAHWATLARVTRISMIEQQGQDYVVAAHARGIKKRKVVWGHMLPNAIAPALTSSVLSAAALVTGVFVVEIIFNFYGISQLAVTSMQFIPDAAAALGFTVYSVLVVLLLMTVLDLVQAIIDPRVREGA
jgi:peptide/nickel transport system permease protein